MKILISKPTIFVLMIVIIAPIFVGLMVFNKNRENENQQPIEAKSIPNKSITLDQLKSMFKNMESDIDTSKPLLWGYFFTHHEPKLLEVAKNELIKMGYRFVDIHISDKDNKKEPDLRRLHVEKEEVHSPESLDKRNDELYMFANKMNLNSYDGMDVGPILESTKK